MVYMGKDKVRRALVKYAVLIRWQHENEGLIKYGFEQDVWFHVDKLSSAHVYLRLAEEWSWDAIPEALVTDLAQLVKANSIQGNKKDNISVIYTPWSNLKKTGDMDVGQVTFHNTRLVKRVHVETRINEIINRLNKTKVERYPDLAEEQADKVRELKRKEKSGQLARKQQELEEARRRKAMKEAAKYDNVFKEENMRTNEDNADLEDDFM